MSNVVYFPLYKISTTYLVRQGRVWTTLEHMLLWRLTKQPSQSLDLAREAAVPVNLVVECLVELLGAGWIQLRTGQHGVVFEATPSGRAASDLDVLPRDWQTRKRSTALCADRLTGGIFSPEDLTVVHRDKMPNEAVVLRPRAFKLALSPTSSLDRLYMMEDEVFEQWLDYRVTSQNLYGVVSIIDGRVVGLPNYASPSLLQAILEEAGSSEGSVKETIEQHVPAQLLDRRFYSEIIPEDLIVGGPEHLSLVRGVLSRAKTLAVVHSCFVGPDAVRQLMPSLEAAAKRDVDVELLWGQRTSELATWSQRAFAEVKSMLDRASAVVKSRVRFAKTETGSHAKILLADSGVDGQFEAYLGSCNWLSAKFEAVEVSIRVRDPWLVGSIAALLAALRMPPSGRWSPDVYRLVHIQTVCRSMAEKRTSGPHELSLVLDKEHLGFIREARDMAKSVVTVGCDLLGPAGETSVFVPMRTTAKSDVKVELYYNNLTRSLVEIDVPALADELRTDGIELKAQKDLHAKFLFWDNKAVLITSFNWLAAAPNPWKPEGSEIGIIIRGDGVARLLSEKLGASFARVNKSGANSA